MFKTILKMITYNVEVFLDNKLHKKSVVFWAGNKTELEDFIRTNNYKRTDDKRLKIIIR